MGNMTWAGVISGLRRFEISRRRVQPAVAAKFLRKYRPNCAEKPRSLVVPFFKGIDTISPALAIGLFAERFQIFVSFRQNALPKWWPPHHPRMLAAQSNTINGRFSPIFSGSGRQKAVLHS